MPVKIVNNPQQQNYYANTNNNHQYISQNNNQSFSQNNNQLVGSPYVSLLNF